MYSPRRAGSSAASWSRGQEVEYGQKMGVILDPFTAEVEAEITCPTSGVVFFALKKPLTTEHEVAFKVIRRLHGGCV